MTSGQAEDRVRPGRRPTVSTRRLDPDALAALEEERDFLLRSLTDLDAEFVAGDIDDHDYAELRDDYTRRAADAIRAIDGTRSAFAAAASNRRSGRQALAWFVGFALVGALAGVAVARSSGTRSADGGITGGVTATSTTRLNEANALLGDESRWPEAIELYDAVVDDDPSNVEAITYGAWLRYRSGEDAQAAIDAWAEARRLEPEFADAAVFTTIALADLGRYDDAAEVLAELDVSGAPPMVAGMIEGRGLDGEVYGESRFATIVASPQPTLDELDLDIDAALAAAGYLLTSDREGGPVAALKLYRAVQSADPDNAAALSREALVLASSGFPDEARELLDRAVAANPDDPEALLSRATVVIGTDVETGCTDVAALLALDAVPEEFTTRADELSASFCG